MNRAQKRASKFGSQQSTEQTSAAKPTDVGALMFANTRTVLVALGVRLDDKDMVAAAVPCVEHLADALKELAASSDAFPRELTSGRARELSAKFLAYAEVFDEAKAAVDRLKGESAAPDGQPPEGQAA